MQPMSAPEAPDSQRGCKIQVEKSEDALHDLHVHQSNMTG
jgi:hypothetical protein